MNSMFKHHFKQHFWCPHIFVHTSHGRSSNFKIEESSTYKMCYSLFLCDAAATAVKSWSRVIITVRNVSALDTVSFRFPHVFPVKGKLDGAFAASWKVFNWRHLPVKSPSPLRSFLFFTFLTSVHSSGCLLPMSQTPAPSRKQLVLLWKTRQPLLPVFTCFHLHLLSQPLASLMFSLFFRICYGSNLGVDHVTIFSDITRDTYF